MLTTSKVLSKHFVVLHEPAPNIAETNYPRLDYAALSKALATKRAPSESSKETFEKTRKAYKEEAEGGRGGAMESEAQPERVQDPKDQNSD